MAGVAAAHPAADRDERAREPSPGRLLWLKWTLVRRGLMRDRTRLIGAIIFLVLVLPVAVLLGVGSYLLYVGLPTPAATEFLFFMLALLFVGWLVVPVFLYSLNDSLDASKLFLYPLSAPRLMVGLLLSSVLDLPIVFLAALFVAVVAGWVRAPAAIVIAPLALVVLYAQMVAASQAVLALLNSVLRSRRFRDISFVLLGVFGTTFFLWQQLAMRQLNANGIRPRDLLAVQVSPWLQWTPPGLIARTIATAAAGETVIALGWLGLAVVWLLALVGLWHWALVRFMTGAEAGGRRAAPARVATSHPGWRLPLPRPVAALAAKDLRYFWRDPQLKAIILNTLLALVMLVVAPWIGMRRGPDLTQWTWLVLSLPLPVIVTALTLSFNAFGMERDGLRVLFLLPVAPSRLFVGKNLAVAAVAGVEAIVIGVALAGISRGWALLPVALAATASGVLVTLAIGNVVSVILPGRMPDGLRATYSTDAGCARGLLQFLAFVCAWVMLAPIAAAASLPQVLGQPALHLVTVPLALLYALAFYWLTLRWVGPQLLRRQPEILAITTRD
ncbi:MAG: hypothetical protein IT340_05935 [Chloroflexi bacterium]|nr:hypothetical protein [Chloroflexota bacterium]